MSIIEQSVLTITLLALVVVGILLVTQSRGRPSASSKGERSPRGPSRRSLLQAAASGVALAITSTVLRPVAAFATHRRCEHRGVTGAYNTCLGNCTCGCSSCCRTSPNGVYRDCCTGCCSGSGCCNLPRQLVVFQIDNRGGCFCYLQAC